MERKQSGKLWWYFQRLLEFLFRLHCLIEFCILLLSPVQQSCELVTNLGRHTAALIFYQPHDNLQMTLHQSFLTSQSWPGLRRAVHDQTLLLKQCIEVGRDGCENIVRHQELVVVSGPICVICGPFE